MKNKPFSLLLLLLTISLPAYAQFTDFPTGFDGIPESKLKGPVHIVLTIEQRGEHVFNSVVEVYDTNGRRIELMSSNAGIEIHSGTMVRLGGKTIFHYDQQGRLTKLLSFTPEGEYTGYELYLYDSENNLTQSTSYDDKGKETGKRTYTYFPEKKEVLATWNFYFDGRLPPAMKNLLRYNEKGQWTQRVEFDFGGNSDAVITFDYDSKGNFIKASKCCKYTYANSYSYKFDSQGNWIEKQNTYLQPNRDPDPEWMRTYRVITYYTDGQKQSQKK